MKKEYEVIKQGETSNEFYKFCIGKEYPDKVEYWFGGSKYYLEMCFYIQPINFNMELIIVLSTYDTLIGLATVSNGNIDLIWNKFDTPSFKKIKKTPLRILSHMFSVYKDLQNDSK